MRCRKGRKEEEEEKCTLRIGRGLGSGRVEAGYASVYDGLGEAIATRSRTKLERRSRWKTGLDGSRQTSGSLH